MDETMLGLIFSVILTAVIYMAFPLLRLIIHKGKFERKKARRIALWNSIVLGIFFFILSSLIGGNITWNAAPALMYYWINKAILTGKTSETVHTGKTTVPSPVTTNTTQAEKQLLPISFCRKCGAKLSEGSNFCNKCGTEVIKE